MVTSVMKLEVVAAERAGDPEIGVGPVAAFLPVFIDGDPFGVGVVDVLMGGVGVGSGDDVHAEFAAACDHFAERIPVSQEFAAVVEGNFGGVEGDAASSGEAGGIGVDALESNPARRRGRSCRGRLRRRRVATSAWGAGTIRGAVGWEFGPGRFGR